MSFFRSTEATIEKLLASASSERRLGNFDTAASFEAKAEKLRNKHKMNLVVKKSHTADEQQAEKKREFEAWLDKQPDAMQVCVWVQEPGMKRLVQRIKPMGVVREMIKSAPGCLASPLPPPKPFRGTSPDGHNPLPPPMTNEQLAALRERAKSGPVEQQAPQEKTIWHRFWN